MGHKCALGFWEAPLRATIRIGFSRNDNKMRGLLWIRVYRDGSIYLGARKPDSRFQKLGAKPIEKRETFIGYDEGELIQDEVSLKNPKLSFHASGTIHAAGKRWFRSTLRGLSEKQLVCQILFQHPTEFAYLGKVGKHDIGLFYPVDDDYPIWGHIYVLPLKTQFTPVQIGNAKYQWSVILAYRGLNQVPDIAVQVVLYHAYKGAWPPATYFVWRAIPDDSQEEAKSAQTRFNLTSNHGTKLIC